MSASRIYKCILWIFEIRAMLWHIFYDGNTYKLTSITVLDVTLNNLVMLTIEFTRKLLLLISKDCVKSNHQSLYKRLIGSTLPVSVCCFSHIIYPLCTAISKHNPLTISNVQMILMDFEICISILVLLWEHALFDECRSKGFTCAPFAPLFHLELYYYLSFLSLLYI